MKRFTEWKPDFGCWVVSLDDHEHTIIMRCVDDGRPLLTSEPISYISGEFIDRLAMFENNPQIENVIFNDPATIVFWSDGTKTVVKAHDEDFDPEKGLAMAISKKMLGNTGKYFDEFKKWLPEEEEEESMSIFDLFNRLRPVKSAYVEKDTKCDRCKYLCKCKESGNLIETTVPADMKRHFISGLGADCILENEAMEKYFEELKKEKEND